jgi:hypothetical protein
MEKIIQFIFLLFAFIACKDVLDPPPQAFLNATICYTDRDKNADLDSITVSVTGVNMDEPWIQDTLVRTNSDTTRTVLLPLNDTPSTDYVFVLNDMTDTVSISSDSKLIYESMETGFYPEFKILDILYTTHRIDYIEVVDSSVTKEWNENIIININTDIITDN